MTWSNFIWRMTILSLTGLGIGGNFCLFVKHVFASVMALKKKLIDLVLIQLAFTNGIALWSSGVYVGLSLHFNSYLGIVGCKTVVYLGRVARGLSICTSCLLSVIQATAISPRTTLWGKLRPRTAWQVLPCLLLFWISNLLISSNLLHYITTVSSMNRSEVKMYLGHCYLLSSTKAVQGLFLTLMALRDIFFQGLMGWSSGHMARHLCEHHKRMLYLRSSPLPNNSSPEIKATINILILMICFLLFYWADFVFSFYIGSVLTTDPTILNTKIFLELGYAIVSPFVLISRDANMVRCWHKS